jgi:hypothetical protein
MNQHLQRAAKRLVFSLFVAATLGGCAIYEPGYPGGYAPYGTYPYWQPAYSGVPYYVGPPVSLDLWFDARSGGHRGGHRGGWGGRRH